MPVILSEESVRSQNSEQNETERKDRHKNFSHDMALPINQLPREILIAIFNLSLLEPSFEIRLYPCIIFSWVCHHWRSVILDNPMFWNRIIFTNISPKDVTHPMVKEFLLRSHTVPLDITSYNSVPRLHELGPDANRVRMLRLGPGVYVPYPPSSYFTSLFPSLTGLFLKDRSKTIDLSIEPLPLFQALEVPIRNLGNLALPNNFPNLWWLQLRYELTLPLLPLLEALRNLPCLRVLYLFPLGRWWDLPKLPKGPTITFHHLEALMTGSPILQLITAPKLSYLQCARYPDHFFMSSENYGHLCGFDFSKTTRIQIGMNCYELSVYIMGTFRADTSDDDMTPLMIKNNHKWAVDEITSSYPNEFYIQVDACSAAPYLLSLFAKIIKKCNNLSEISLHYDYLIRSEWGTPTDREKAFFLDALRSAIKVRNLTVFGNDFVTFCGYLNDGTVCPNLQRLAYYTQKKQDFLDPLLKLMTERSEMCPQSLEVELTGFSTVPPEALEPAERLGLRLIQNPGDLSPNSLRGDT